MMERTEVQVAEIVDSRWQTRQDGYSGPEFDELVASVREHGIINPPGVFVNEGEEYELVYGHRRLAAARKAALVQVPVTVLGHLVEPDEYGALASLETDRLLNRFQQMVIADNLYHQNLSAMELARAVQDLIEKQGLTQKEVGVIFGKSQQWVSDKISLLDLAPEVQEQLTERAVEESVARKLASLPADYQQPAAEYVKGMTSRDANQRIQEIAAATDPSFWDLPQDKPWSPQQMNVKAMMDDCLDQVPDGQMGETILKLHGGYRLYRPEDREPWSMPGVAEITTGKKQDLDAWLVDHGRTCEECVFQGEGLFYPCGREETKTCRSCLTADDPVRLPKPDPEGGCADCEGAWCEDVACYVQKIKAQREAKSAEMEEKDLERSIERLDEVRAFYDRQLQEGVDNDHWLAQACQHCADFRGPDQREQCGWEQAGDQSMDFWQSGETIVPRCSAWQLRDPQRIPEIDQGCFDEILLTWLEWDLASVWEYLPGEDEEAKAAYLRSGALNRKQLAALVTYKNNPDLGYWKDTAEIMNPITGEMSTWSIVGDDEETEDEE